jgi:tRNA-dihydrouridine synthase
MIPDKIDPEIVRLFPSVKSGVVERGLWRIPVFFDKSFGKNRGCIRLRRYIVHMAETGETKEAMMNKTMEIYNEFSELIDRYPADENTNRRRREQLDKYMQEFVDEVTKLIAEGDSTHVY